MHVYKTNYYVIAADNIMWKLPILAKEKGSSGKDRGQPEACYRLARPLPISYMAEYSVLGLLVDKLEKAVRVLGENRFPVIDEAGDLAVAVNQPGQLHEIVRLLKEHGIECEIADVVSGVYQG
jgi:hypothetical protein